MSPVLRYTIWRLAIFIACAVPAMLFLPALDPLLRLMIAVLASAGISYVALRGLRDEVSQRLAQGAQRRAEERARLRTALAGDEHGGPSSDEG